VSANHARSERRRERLAQRLRQELPAALSELGVAEQSGALTDALSTLAPADQEVLRLAAWEQLSPGQIASVLGLSSVTARSRLPRARRRLRAALAGTPSSTTSTPLRLKETE
jgi:RNA polymerase sigma factor (sigma-70 family)